MSIKLMSIAWDMDIPSTEKMVLLCLCDYANDDGRSCYPSIATLAKRTSKNARTVQRALRWLESSKICNARERAGTSTDYAINLDAYVTPDKMSPLTKTTQWGGVVSPRGRRGVTQTINEPPLTVNNNICAKIQKPDGVEQDVWDDFQKHRKAKKAVVSKTAMAGIEREAAKAGWRLNDALAEIVTRGWTGFKADWVKDDGKTNRASATRNVDGFSLAIQQAERAFNGAGNGNGEPWDNNPSGMRQAKVAGFLPSG